VWLAGVVLVIAAVALSGAVGLSAIAGTASAANGTTVIDGCTVIDEPGTYELGGNLTDVNDSRMIGGSDTRATCIDIRASDVTLDGNGYVFDSADPSSSSEQRGISVNGTFGARENVTVRNITLTDWPRAVWVRNASGVTVVDVDVRVRDETIPRGQAGVVLGRFSSVSGSVVRDSAFEEYYNAIKGGDGNITVRNNVVHGQIDVGGPNVTVVDNDVRAVSDASEGNVRVSGDGGTVSDNAVEDGNVEIEGANLSVTGNTVRNLTTAGFGMSIFGSGHDVRNNTIEGNERGMTVGGREHVLRDNVLRNNTENFHLRRYADLRTTKFSDLVSLDIDTSNTIDGNPIYVFQEVTDRTFTNDDAGYLAYINSSGVTVRDITLTNNTDGLLLANVTDSTIEGTTLRENAIGMEMAGGDNVTVRRNQIANNTEDGIVGIPARIGLSNVSVVNNTVTGNGAVGVDLQGRNLTIADNDVTENGAGVDLTGDRSTVLGNDVAANDGYGIRVTADNVSVRDNSVTGNGEHGIFFDFSRNNEFEAIGNNVTNNGKSGVLVDTRGGRLLDNTLIDNGESGIHIFNDGSAVIRNNTARRNTYGIRLYHDATTFGGANDNLVEDNVVTGNTYGIEAGSSAENNTIRDNVATGNENGIYLDQVGDHRVLDNNASANSGDGIYVDDYTGSAGTDTRIANNTALENGDDGIELEDSERGEPPGPFEVRDNDILGNGDTGILIERADNVVVAGNGRVSDNDGAEIDVENSANVTVQNHTVTGNGVGFLALSSDFSVANLNASDNDGDGIRITDTTGLRLGQNVTANDNADDGIQIEDGYDVHVLSVPTNDNGGNGIELVDPETVSIRETTANDNYAAGIAVVDDDFDQEGNVTVRNVTVRRNGVGIDVERVERTTIVDSTIADGNASMGSMTADINVPANGFEDRIPVNGTGVVLESAGNASLLNTTVTGNDGKGIVATLSAAGTYLAENDVTDNGGTGIAFVEASGPSTIAANVVSDNGGLELYDTYTTPNGENGVSLMSSSNVTVRNNTIERNEKHGVRIRDESNDNVIGENTIASHVTANGTGHGVFVEGLGVNFGFPTNTTVTHNEITDNDYGVSMFHDVDSVVRGNAVLRNGIGVRVGSNTEPISSRETTECTDSGVLEFLSEFGGSTDGTVMDNHIEAGGTALKIITHPTSLTNCDGTITDISYDDPTVEGYVIANNHLEGSEPINVTNSRLDYPTAETYDSSFNGSNAWNASKTADGNVLGGPYRAGNYWATPNGTGFSQTCTDADGDGICDSNRSIATNNVDELPLAPDQPAFFDVAIDSTTSPGVSGDPIDVTATITNSGNASATRTIELSVDGTVAGSVSRTLDPGESTTETFTWDTSGVLPGEYAATIESDTDSASVPVTIEPNVSVRIDGTNAPITDSGTLRVDATVRNNRAEPVTETIELLEFNGIVVDGRTISLDAGASASISLSWATAAGDAGTRTVTVRSANDADRTDITVRSGATSDCTEITESGNYRLEGNISTSTAPCIEVEASGVTIDGQGHTLAGTGSGAGVLLNVGAGAESDIALRNLTIRDVSTAVEVPVGDAESISGVRLEHVTTANVEDNALYAQLGKNGTIDGLTIEGSVLAADSEGILVDQALEAGPAIRDFRVRNTVVTAGDVGISLDVAYDRGVVDGVELTNSTITADAEGVEIDADDADTAVRNVTIARTAIESRYESLYVDYSSDDAILSSVRVTDSRLRSESNAGVEFDGDHDRTVTRNVTIANNDVNASGAGLDFAFDYDDAVVEGLRVADNRITADGSEAISLQASDTGVTVEAVLRNNTIASASTGIELDLGNDLDSGTAYDVTVANNHVSGFTDTGIDVAEVILNETTAVRVLNNTVRNESGVVTGVSVETADGDSPAGATLDLIGNDVRTGGDAVVIDATSDRVETITLTGNALVALGFGVDNRATDVSGDAWVNATGNYWNASDGPGSVGAYEDPVTGALANGTGSAVSNGSSARVANVRFDPFLATSPADSNASEGSAVFDATIRETNSPVLNGSDFVVTAEITNTGDLAGTKDVELSVLGSSAVLATNRTDLTLGAGESANVTLSVSTADIDAGNYTAFIGATADGRPSTELEVREPDPAFFDTTIRETNSPVLNGSDYVVTAEVENTGDLAATKGVDLSVVGSSAILATNGTDLTLAPGESANVTLTISTAGIDAGNYTAFIGVPTDVRPSTTLAVIDSSGGFFDVSIDGTNAPIEEGETLSITATVENTGSATASRTVNLTTDGVERDTTTVTLAPGENTTITLTWATTAGDAGSYSVTVASKNDTAVRSVNVTSPSATVAPGQPGFGPVVSAIALLLALATLRRRAR